MGLFKPKPLTKCTIEVRTPEGYAKKTSRDWAFNIIKTVIFSDLFRRTKVKEEIVDRNIIRWHITAPLTQIITITKRVGMYDTLIEGIFKNLFKILNNNMMKKANKKLSKAFKFMSFDKINFDFSVSEQTKKEAYDLLKNHTKIEIIR